MGSMLCCSNKANRYRRLDRKLERKIAEMKKSSSSSSSTGQRNFKSIDSVVMRFPHFKDGLKTLRGMFEQYDEDSNGSIDHSELRKCFEQLQLHLPEEEIKDLFHYCDIDGNKGIQFNEFIVLLCLIYLLEEPSSSSNVELAQLGAIFNTIVEVFLFLDKNGDGKLNKKDMVKTLNETYPWERSPANVTNIRFKEMDWDKNGQVTFREFLFGFLKWVGIDEDESMHQSESYNEERTD
ncbi:putative calcium-binding protein CML22 isoform X1 [Senna tora]|uniref:Putative calcium-binding protein CML22 isoform X1 n=1 Tax=Senna tora TaxID=362788 RepID=A0A835CCZ3_9FABA|nr:putative calcium-binding protein CML22 isoform X1 [Senna tora]